LTPESHTLHLHDALPISQLRRQFRTDEVDDDLAALLTQIDRRARVAQAHDQAAGASAVAGPTEIDGLDAAAQAGLGVDGACGGRSEEHTSELQSRENLVC